MLQHELTDDCNSLAEKGKLKEEEEEEQQEKEAGRQRAMAALPHCPTVCQVSTYLNLNRNLHKNRKQLLKYLWNSYFIILYKETFYSFDLFSIVLNLLQKLHIYLFFFFVHFCKLITNILRI